MLTLYNVRELKSVWCPRCPSHTCEVGGLYGLDEIRLFHFKPLQQLGDEAHDVELRGAKKQVRLQICNN